VIAFISHSQRQAESTQRIGLEKDNGAFCQTVSKIGCRMNLSFANIRCAIDVLRGRLPGALAMLKAEDIAISVHHNEARREHWCNVQFFFPNGGDASQAYRAVERLYEMDRRNPRSNGSEG